MSSHNITRIVTMEMFKVKHTSWSLENMLYATMTMYPKINISPLFASMLYHTKCLDL